MRPPMCVRSCARECLLLVIHAPLGRARVLEKPVVLTFLETAAGALVQKAVEQL